MDPELYTAALEGRFPISFDIHEEEDGTWTASYNQHDIEVSATDESMFDAQNQCRQLVLDALKDDKARLTYG